MISSNRTKMPVITLMGPINPETMEPKYALGYFSALGAPQQICSWECRSFYPYISLLAQNEDTSTISVSPRKRFMSTS